MEIQDTIMVGIGITVSIVAWIDAFRRQARTKELGETVDKLLSETKENIEKTKENIEKTKVNLENVKVIDAKAMKILETAKELHRQLQDKTK